MSKKETGLSTKLSEEQMAILDSSYPVETGFNRVLLPRFGMVSQDVMEGKGKQMKVVTEAGTFFIEKQMDEVDADGKKKWERAELGKETEAIILFERKQIKFYDGEKYTSSPIFDTNDQVLPLFRDKIEVDRGLPEELKKRAIYQGKSAKGKDISKLEDNKILYVLYEGEVYQMNLRGTSMYSFMTYKKGVQPNKVLTRMNSEAKENGSTAWNQMTFESVRPINGKEADVVIQHLKDIKAAIDAEKAFYSSRAPKIDKEKAMAVRVKDEDFS